MCSTCGCDNGEHNHHHDNEKTVKVEQDILGENNRLAMYNRGWFRGKEIFALNIVSSPGSGKTSLLEATIKEMKNDCEIAVIEGDQQTDNDAQRITAHGVRAHQINTQSGCHLDAHMVWHAVENLKPLAGSILFIENVGNLVCPAMFDLGESMRVVVISVTEGDDKPLKYPYMFAQSDVCVINKVDLLPYVPCDIAKLKENCLRVNPRLRIFEISSTVGTGIEEWCTFLKSKLVTPDENYFDKIAHTWDSITHHDMGKIERILAKVGIEKGAEILDVGTGTGVLIPFIASAVGASGVVVGVDSSSKMLDEAKIKYGALSNVRFRIGDIEKMTLNEKFDRIILFSMFPHLANPIDTVTKLVTNNLSPKGTLTIAHSQSKEAINQHHSHVGDNMHSFELPAVEELAKSFEQGGLEVVSMTDSDEIYMIILRKGV